jgi:hypothetical protein
VGGVFSPDIIDTGETKWLNEYTEDTGALFIDFLKMPLVIDIFSIQDVNCNPAAHCLLILGYR